jgi:transcriptional regulator with XRE-family HTH domain
MAGISLLGFEIKKLRSMRKMSQEDLAIAVGTSVTSISGIETGRHKPRQSLLTRLAEVLHVPVEKLESLADGIEPVGVTTTKSGMILKEVDFDTHQRSIERISENRVLENDQFICSFITKNRISHSTGDRRDILDFLDFKLSSTQLTPGDCILIRSNSGKGSGFQPDLRNLQEIRSLLQNDSDED